MAFARAGIEKLKGLPKGTPVLEVLELFDEATAILSDASARASVVRNSHPDVAMRDVADEAEQAFEKLSTDISLDRGVFDVLVALDVSKQDLPTQHWAKRVLRDFRRAGVDRDEATRNQVKQLSEELVRIGQAFGTHIREDVRSVEVAPSALEGMPEDYLRGHPVGANGLVRISTDTPDYLPFMTYSKDGAARESLWRTYRQRGFPKNVTVLEELLAKRHALASLLGYRSWAAYATEDKMIRSEQAAADFIEKIAEASGARCQRDYDALLARKRKEEPKAEKVNPWDQAYLEDRISAEQYSFDSRAVRPYFEYSRVKEGVLSISARMFGITYAPVPDAPRWHPDVEVYDVLQDGKALGRFFLDMHPREGKYKHAAQFTLATGKAQKRLPEGVLMCNFPRPGKEAALMQHSDVKTFFHEFGHLLHHIFGGHTRWAGLSGVRTEWDFVEAPSQMLEEWAWDAPSLATFARHFETNEPLPAETIARMKRADEFGKGLWVRQQMFYAAMSLELYRRAPKDLNPVALVRELQGRYTPFPYVENSYFHLSFGHLDGYSAIYYTYMWSLVIAKDLFTVFKNHGLLNAKAAAQYRRSILEPGGSQDAADLVKDFLGRDYDFGAYQEWLDSAA